MHGDRMVPFMYLESVFLSILCLLGQVMAGRGLAKLDPYDPIVVRNSHYSNAVM